MTLERNDTTLFPGLEGERLNIAMEKQQRKRSDGLDSVKTGVKVLFHLQGGRTEGDREGHSRFQNAWHGEGYPESQF